MTNPRVRPGLDQLMILLQHDPRTPELPNVTPCPYRDSQSRDDQNHRPGLDYWILGQEAPVERTETRGACEDEETANAEDCRGQESLSGGFSSFGPSNSPGAEKPIEHPGRPQGGHRAPGNQCRQGFTSAPHSCFEIRQASQPSGRHHRTAKRTASDNSLTISDLDGC
jgi:hypothetical protein